jgi:hypothetical protein
MRIHRDKAAVLIVGAVMTALAVMAFAVPGSLAKPQEQGETGTIVADEERGPQGGATCCSGEEGPCCCSKNQEEKGDEPKDNMKMASPEAMAKGMKARQAIVEHQKALAGEGIYGCCIKPGCTFCSTSADMCPCAANLKKGDPVCPECWGGWQAGRGRLTGVETEKVKLLPKEKLKMMYDMRSKNFEKAEEK